MIFPTLKILRQQRAGSNLYGEPMLLPPIAEMVCPVKLEFNAQHTTVRTDSSATTGAANETTANVVLLFLPRSAVKVDDILTVQGYHVKVVLRHPRFDITGKLDHLELHCQMAS